MPVSGDLADMDVTSIISINCNEMNEARLVVRHADDEARIFFEDGNIVHMSLGVREGERVIHEILAWEEGTFQLEQGVSAPKRTVTRSWSDLLMNGMQRLDEGVDDESVLKDAEVRGQKEAEAGAIQEQQAAGEVTSGVTEGAEFVYARPDLRTLAGTLFQVGLDHGLSPYPAVLEASETTLPGRTTEEDDKLFKEWLIEAYQRRFDQELKRLRIAIGLEKEGRNH